MRSKGSVLIFLAIFAVTAQACSQSSGPEGRTAGSVTSRCQADGIASVTYEWTDPNTEKIIRWEGDTRIVDARFAPRKMSYVAEISLQRLRAAIESFGIPEDQMTIAYAGAADLRRKQLQRKRRLEERGMSVDGKENTIRILYNWVIDRSVQDLRHASAGLAKQGAQGRQTGARELLGVFSSFVQSLEYRVQSEYRKNAKGEKILTGGVTMPLETLYNGWGDCDTKCLLFASLLSNIPKTTLVLLVGNSHAFVGIRGTPRINDRYVKIKGIHYILAELTSTWPLGRIPDDTWKAVGRNRFRIYPVYARN